MQLPGDKWTDATVIEVTPLGDVRFKASFPVIQRERWGQGGPKVVKEGVKLQLLAQLGDSKENPGKLANGMRFWVEATLSLTPEGWRVQRTGGRPPKFVGARYQYEGYLVERRDSPISGEQRWVHLFETLSKYRAEVLDAVEQAAARLTYTDYEVMIKQNLLAQEQYAQKQRADYQAKANLEADVALLAHQIYQHPAAWPLLPEVRAFIDQQPFGREDEPVETAESTS